jgi:hypothetical protein
VASLWLRRLGLVVAAAALWAGVVEYASGSQKASLKQSLHQMRYYGGPKSPMWRG